MKEKRNKYVFRLLFLPLLVSMLLSGCGTQDESSDICKMNQSNGASTEVGRETAEVLQFALSQIRIM